MDYNNGKIYQVVSNDGEMIYIGSTTQPLSKRFVEHRSQFNRNGGGKHNRCISQIFERYGVENCKIELLENFPCTNKDQLNAREGFWIRQTDCVNKRIAGRTQQDWEQEHPESMVARRQRYRENNLEYIREYDKNYKRLLRHKEKFAEVLEELLLIS
jgi:adenylate kinase family enzyme